MRHINLASTKFRAPLRERCQRHQIDAGRAARHRRSNNTATELRGVSAQ